MEELGKERGYGNGMKVMEMKCRGRAGTGMGKEGEEKKVAPF